MTNSLDRLSSLFERFRVHAHLFHTGPLCGVTHFAAEPGRAFLHVLRRGTLDVTHRVRSGAPRKIHITQPTLLFYPRPLEHDFHNAPSDGSDFVCATLNFESGNSHPLVRTLPPVLVLPLSQIAGLEQVLSLLFAETEHVLCGQGLIADRLFEVLLLQLLRWLLDHPQEAGIQTGLIKGMSHPKLASTLSAMHERPGQPWSLSTMADQAGMSRSAFAQTFKEHVGTTPAEYLLQWRISLAQSMLLNGTSLKQISDDLGYASPASFSRTFTQTVNTGPRAWLEANHHGS